MLKAGLGCIRRFGVVAGLLQDIGMILYFA